MVGTIEYNKKNILIMVQPSPTIAAEAVKQCDQ